MASDKDFFINLLDPANITFTDAYINELHAGRVGAENITTAAPWEDSKRTTEKFSEYHALFEKHQDKIQLVERFQDLEEARSRGKVGIILGLQSATPIGEDLGLLRIFYRLGLRTIGIVYQRRNVFGDGCGEPKDSGLSKLGERLVEEVNRQGMVIDLSHTGRKASLEAIEISKAPVIFSHSNAKALLDSVRNIDDEVIKATAEKGGVIGLVSYGPLLRKDRRATMDDLLKHVDHLAKLVGVDHIGIGMDAYPPTPKEFHEDFKRRFPEIAGAFPYETTIEGLEHAAKWRNLASALEARGYSRDEVRKILGENGIRVFKRVWKS